MTDPRVSIGRVKRDISELVNRVAFGKERIVLTSRGKPKAVIVSLEDYESLRNDELEEQRSGWEAWLAQNRKVAAEILEERNGVPINVDELWEEYRTELEKRHDFLLDN